jgi:Spy/CpxP family protein refolding chaperone
MRGLVFALAVAPLGALALPSDQPAAPAKTQAAPADRSSEAFGPKRLRLARSLGLAVALDLEEDQAGQMRALMAKYDARCRPLRRRHLEASRLVRRIAHGERATASVTDAAVREALDLEAQIGQVHREMFEELSSGLSPRQRARAAVFFAAFRDRFGVEAESGRAGAARRGERK